MKARAAVTLIFLLIIGGAPARAEGRAVGVVEVFERGGHFGTLTRTASGVSLVKPNPAREAVDRWGASAEAFAQKFTVSRGGNGTEAFMARRVYEDPLGQVHVRLSQRIAGVPVVGSEVIVHADIRTGEVFGVNGRFAIDRGLPRAPRVSGSEAVAASVSEYRLHAVRVEGTPDLTYFVDEHAAIRLAWTTLIAYLSANGAEVDRIYADALTGTAIARHPQVRRAGERKTYDCGNRTYKCLLVYGMGADGWYWTSPPGSKAAAAHENAGTAYDYFLARHGRNSLDAGGMVVEQLISFDVESNRDVGWYPPGTYDAIAYGDGVGFYYPEPVRSLDIVAHEYTHGVIYYEATLPYENEQGSIDEGLADVFAVAVDAYRDGAPDWWIAEDVYSPGTLGDAMRYLNDPALQNTYRDYYPNRRRNETHPNAGITGLAFYLLSIGGTHPRRPSPVVAGVGLTAAEHIFYRALATYMTRNTNFRMLRQYTLWAAADLHGIASATYTSVNDAWAAVGNHWDEQVGSLSAGASWISPSYTATTEDLHTGQLSGPGGANFDLFLERWTGSAWVTNRSATTTTGTTELIEAFPLPGMFRWRVTAASGSGSYTFHWNHPL